jgi:hypothetical protein
MLANSALALPIVGVTKIREVGTAQRCGTQSLRDFKRALVTNEVSVSSLAKAWGVSDGVVKNVLAGRAPLTDWRVENSPKSVQRSFYEARLKALGDDHPPACGGPLWHAAQLTDAFSRLFNLFWQAVADRRIDDVEHIELQRGVGKLIEAARTFLSSVSVGEVV